MTTPSEAIRGWGSILGIAKETTYGTPVAASTNWLGLLGHSLQPTRTVDPVAYLGQANGQVSSAPTDSLVTAHDFGGEVETLLEYGNPAQMLLFEHFFGALATTGSNPYTHTFTVDESKYYDGTNVGLTGQVINGQHSSLAKCEVVAGLVVDMFEISMDARGMVRLKYGLIGVSGGSFTSITGTAAVTNTERVLGSHCARMAWNSGNYQLNRVTITAKRNLERRPNLGNGLYTDKPQPSGQLDITVNGELDWTSHALDTGIDAATQSDAVFTFTGGTSPNALVVTIDAAQCTNVGRNLVGPGRRVQSFDMRGHYRDTSNRGIKLAFTNATSPAYAS